jgi:hypothetical protein
LPEHAAGPALGDAEGLHQVLDRPPALPCQKCLANKSLKRVIM